MAEQVAIVTGAGAGIGRAVCMQLAELGWALALVGRTEHTLRETASMADIEDRAQIIVADVADHAAAALILEKTFDRFERLDAIVNNAGLAVMQPFAELDDDQLQNLFEVNALGPMRLMLHAWPHLVASRGRIVNVSSVSSLDPYPGLGTYGVAKLVLNQIARTISTEHADAPVKAFTVAPGAVETQMLRGLFSEDRMPRNITLDPADVARIIVDCATGKRDRDAGDVITVPNPSA